MTKSLIRRGPDDLGHFLGHSRTFSIGLGFRRLSIVDLSPAGNQPLCSEDGKIQLVFNGEIYNYRVLREELLMRGHRFRSATDGETIVHGYEEWGEQVLRHIEGMFAFALWD
ncbi:MAG TPA: asparagine synthetase B, partial [Acidobacteriota bacterium]|nr:asparagine synthetase B [Acidobacteriota bacterium]